MKKLRQGDIVFVDLNPTKGVETNKKRPCVVVSNNQYNDLLNTIIVAPISSSPKYQENTKYVESPLFINLLDTKKIKGTILLQHLRSIDPTARINQSAISRINEKSLERLREIVHQFF
ncbi:type II toxin-antitoxin system PemK/MazF family toxin [Enterococcus sp. UD-01]|jgi:mRNA interferase MazF|uniref:type II toxin-antitoxin system PemK/MazF family toxin n=1 Tax=Enterococcus sp. UD-01 TaxID=3373911 RepID=UPI0038333829